MFIFSLHPLYCTFEVSEHKDCLFLDKKWSDAMNEHESSIRLPYYSAKIEFRCFWSYMYCIELPQNFGSQSKNKKHHQVVQLLRIVENKHKNDNISSI